MPSTTPEFPTSSINQESLFWKNVKTIIDDVSKEYDKLWIKRNRGINSKFLIDFIFHIIANGDNGYAVTLGEMWNNYLLKSICPPQDTIYSQSSVCAARQKLPESIFKELNHKLTTEFEKSNDSVFMENHRIFAVDGSKITLPKELEGDNGCNPKVMYDKAQAKQEGDKGIHLVILKQEEEIQVYNRINESFENLTTFVSNSSAAFILDICKRESKKLERKLKKALISKGYFESYKDLLLDLGYKQGDYMVNNEGAYYHQGLLSCIYNLSTYIIHDFCLTNKLNERVCAADHLEFLQENDIAMFDRGYFSYLLLHQCDRKKIHPVFRLQGNLRNKKIMEFINT